MIQGLRESPRSSLDINLISWKQIWLSTKLPHQEKGRILQMFLSKLDKNPIKKVTQYISYICIVLPKDSKTVIS